jgi:hypothetical protein
MCFEVSGAHKAGSSICCWYVSRFMEKPTTDHLLAMKRVLRYIVGTVDLVCHYGTKEGTSELIWP